MSNVQILPKPQTQHDNDFKKRKFHAQGSHFVV